MARYLTLDKIRTVAPKATKARKVYSLFKRLDNGRYERVTNTAYEWSSAIFVYRDRLIAFHAKGTYAAIRPVVE